MKGASWAVLLSLALSGCADEVAFELELRLDAGQAVADLETSKIYNGPGTFVLERRGAVPSWSSCVRFDWRCITAITWRRMSRRLGQSSATVIV